MKQVGCSAFVALLLATPVLAQDPFESTVGAAQGDVVAKFRKLVPDTSPSASQLRTYLEAARYFGLGASVRIDDGRGRSWSRLGDAQVPTGTKISMAAKFRRPSNGGSPVLSELSIVPSRPIHTDDFVFHRLDMDRCGNLHAKLNAQGRAINLDINRIYRDRRGNLVFNTYASNQGALVNAFVPDFRITPDGRLQTRRKNAILPRNRNWKQEYKNGRPVSIGKTLPIKTWPPRLSDLIELLPKEGAPSGNESGFALPSLPISDLGLRTWIQTDPMLLGKDDDGRLVLRDAEISADIHGPVRNGVLTTDPKRPNGFRVKGKLDGLVDTPDVKAKLISLEIEVDGKTSGRVPLNDLGSTTGAADLSLTVKGDVADIHTRKEDGSKLDLKRGKVTLLGNARIEVDKKRRGVSGVLEDTEVQGEYTRLVITDKDGTKVSSESGDLSGTINGAVSDKGIDRARVRGSLTTTGPTTIDLPLAEGLAEGVNANIRLAPGTRLEGDTNEMRPDEDGNLVSTPNARVKAHIKLESGTVDYKSMISAGFVGDGTIDLDAALGLKIDPSKLVSDDGTPVVGPVPLDLKMTIGFAPNSKLTFGPPGRQEDAGDKNGITFGGKTTIELDVKGEIDPETGKASLKGINGANVKFKGEPIDTKKLRELAESAVMVDNMMGGKILQGAKVEFTPNGLVIKTKEGGELKVAPNEVGIRRGGSR